MSRWDRNVAVFALRTSTDTERWGNTRDGVDRREADSSAHTASIDRDGARVVIAFARRLQPQVMQTNAQDAGSDDDDTLGWSPSPTPSLHEWPAQVRVLRHKAAALQTGQPPSRSQVWISGHWRQETARTNRQVPQHGRQDTNSLPHLHGSSNKCGDWPRASDPFRGATPDFHRSARVGPSKDHHFRGHVASSRIASAEGVKVNQACADGDCHNHSTRWARS